ncbi:MAG: lytic transglycosylase domain-containing protein [Rhodospirillaceae bacterium]|nr:lytic transglycosylase domain-containing protein [Rhodospirillaceae bacterium]
MTDPAVLLTALALITLVMTLGAMLPAQAVRVGGRRAARGIGPGDAPVLAAGVALGAAVIVAAWTQLGPWHRGSAEHLRGRAFELVEREFLYREQVHEATLGLLRRAHRQEIETLRAAQESAIALLREQYEDAWLMLAENSEQLVRTVATQFGLNPDFLAAVASQESGFDPFIANTLSGARGLFQFMPATWNEMGQVYGQQIADAGLNYQPVTSENRGTEDDPRNNPRMNAVLGAMLVLYNIELTGSSDPGILYLAHFAGPEMARYVAEHLTDTPDQPIRDVLRQIMPNLADAVIEQNAAAYTEETTLADFYRWSAAHFPGIPTALAEAPEDGPRDQQQP